MQVPGDFKKALYNLKLTRVDTGTFKELKEHLEQVQIKAIISLYARRPYKQKQKVNKSRRRGMCHYTKATAEWKRYFRFFTREVRLLR